jgi:molecular chaperone Hsp33
MKSDPVLLPRSPEDVLLRAIWPETGLRVVAAIATGVAREASRRHGAVGGSAVALGRAVTAGALLATITKSEERITIEMSGGGPLGPLIVDANGAGDVRAFIKNPGVPMAAAAGVHVSLGHAMGHDGVVRVARDLGLRETVNGQTAMVDGEIDTDIEHYLEASEQIPSVLACEALLDPRLEIDIAAGLLVQTLPNSDALPVLATLRERLRGGSLSRALGRLAATGGDVTALAETLLEIPHGHLLCLDERPLQFACPCSRQRAIATLSLLSAQDLAEMVAEGKGAEVTCEFCRQRHVVAPEELERVRESAAGARPS